MKTKTDPGMLASSSLCVACVLFFFFFLYMYQTWWDYMMLLFTAFLVIYGFKNLSTFKNLNLDFSFRQLFLPGISFIFFLPPKISLTFF